jgi:hypothetical protein
MTRVRAGRLGFYSRQGERYFSSPLPGTLYTEIKRPESEADYSLQSLAEVKNAWSCTSTPPYVFMEWYVLQLRQRQV